MASLKFRHYATESALIGSNTLQVALNAMDVGDIVFIDDTQKQYIITSKNNNVATYSTYYGKAAITGVTGTGATRTLTFSDGSEITITINNVDNAKHANTADTAVSAASATTDSSGNNIVNTYARIDKVYDDSDSSGYRQFLGKNGDSSGWIRTTVNGIIPYTSGDSSHGHCSLGTPGWYFSQAYIQNIYGYLYGNISGSSTSCSGNSATATNADTLDGYHVSSLVKFYLSPMTNGAPADSAKSWFTDMMPSGSGAIVYNVPGVEKTIIAGKSTGACGHMLQLNYNDNYLRILRYYGGKWKTDDWEKISAGHADTATVATTATTAINDGNGNVIASTYLPLSGGTLTGGIEIGNNHITSANKEVLISYSGVDTYLEGGSNIYLAAPNLYKVVDDITYAILHSGNFNSYAPKLDGTGATGTWGISISGNAATATNAENISSISPQLAASLEADEINVKRKIDWNFWGDGGYQLEAAIDFNWYETHNLFGVLRGSSTNSAGFGWMYSPDGSTYTQIARLSPSGQLYLASSLTLSGAISGATDITASGTVTSSNADFLRSTFGSYGTIFEIYKGKMYVLLTDKDRQTGANNSLRPLTIEQSNGNIYLATTTEKVGIGTTSPTSKLHVAGTGYFTSDVSSASNIIAGGYIKGETVKISSGCTLQYDSTQKCVKFVF